MPVDDLRKMFRPSCIAVVGASEEEGSVGRTIVSNLTTGFKGKLHLINPNRDEVLGLKCHSDVKQLPGPVDLAVIATPAATVPGIVEDCGDVGIPTAIVISAGFGESGPEGRVLEEQLIEARLKSG